MKPISLLMLCLVASWTSGCAHGSGPASDTFCLTEKPWRPNITEYVLASDATVRRMLAHNMRGAKQCGWKP